MNLKKYVRDIENFPKPGICFKDITPLLGNREALVSCADQLAALVPKHSKIQKVIGIEARGFVLGGMLAERLGAGFVPVRKKGKLPAQVVSECYDLEYGTDILEIHKDAIAPGEHVIIHDDVLATGGTAKAVCDLVSRLGGVVVQCNFMMILSFLKGEDKIQVPIASVLKY